MQNLRKWYIILDNKKGKKMKKNTVNKLSLTLIAILITGCGTPGTSDSVSSSNLVSSSISTSVSTSNSVPVQKFTVTFDVNSGVGEIDSQEVEKGAKATCPTTVITLLGYEFKGWTLVKDEGPIFDFDTPINEDIKLYAFWQINVQEVNYYLNYLEGAEDLFATDEVSYNGTLVAPELGPDRDHHSFTGWYSDPSCDEEDKIDFESYVVVSDLNLYAGWEIETNEVSFKLFNGDDPEPQMIAYGGYVTRPTEEPTRINATFQDWYEDYDCTIPFDFENTEITNATTIYAGWNTAYGIAYVGADHMANPEPSASDSFTFNAGLGFAGTTVSTLMLGKVFYLQLNANEFAEEGYENVVLEFKMYHKDIDGQFVYLDPNSNQNLIKLKLLVALEGGHEFEEAVQAYMMAISMGAGTETIMLAYEAYQRAYNKLLDLFQLGAIGEWLIPNFSIDPANMSKYNYPLHISIAEPGEYRLKILLETDIGTNDIAVGILDFIVQ